MKLFVDHVVVTSPDERRPEVPPAGLSNRRQAGCLQVLVEALHLVRGLLWKEEEVVSEEPIYNTVGVDIL